MLLMLQYKGGGSLFILVEKCFAIIGYSLMKCPLLVNSNVMEGSAKEIFI